jgi:hypothetical protein
MVPLDSALKTGLDTMLWCCDIVISTCYAIVLLGGAMSSHVGGRCVLCFAVQPKKSCGQLLRRDSHGSCDGKFIASASIVLTTTAGG